MLTSDQKRLLGLIYKSKKSNNSPKNNFLNCINEIKFILKIILFRKIIQKKDINKLKSLIEIVKPCSHIIDKSKNPPIYCENNKMNHGNQHNSTKTYQETIEESSLLFFNNQKIIEDPM